MRAATSQRTVTTGGVEQSAFFQISLDDQTHIMTILRDTLYSDKVLAVLREYSANAWDAHRQFGKADVPIKVTIPTDMDPTLRIRDFGPGMSPDEVFSIYALYGASTKRGDDVAVGMMGIGSKSGFSYSDTFTVTSWNGGMKRVYVALLDETDTGKINLLTENPCDASETGIEIQVPIKRQDIWEFSMKARTLFRYFTPRPDINLVLDDLKQVVVKSGFINEDSTQGWVAVMGCIPYRVNPEQIRDLLERASLWEAASRMSGGMYFNIGDVQINASREELKYSDKTKKALVEHFALVLRQYTEQLIKDLSDDSLTPWEKRQRGLGLLGRMRGTQLPLPFDSREYLRDGVRLNGIDDEGKLCPPKTFVVINFRDEQVNELTLNPDMVLVVKDDHRVLQGYDLPHRNIYIIRPYRNSPLEKVRQELDEALARAKMTGVPVQDISTFNWNSVQIRGGKTANKKHWVSTFRLIATGNSGILSQNWGIESREPTDEDVFVILSRFEAESYGSFYSDYRQDALVAAAVGLKMPPVYGYKTTEKKPVTPSDCKGTHYIEWRKGFLQKIAKNAKVSHALKVWQQSKVMDAVEDYFWRYDGNTPEIMVAKLAESLTEKHPIVVLLRDSLAARQKIQGMPLTLREALPTLIGIVKIPGVSLDDIYTRYPLLRVGGNPGLRALWREHKASWIEYINLMDEARERKEKKA